MSQNGTILINVKNLLIDDNDNSIYTVETFAVGTHKANLGTYESKERALEVLDEIRNILTLNTLSSAIKKAYNMNNYVYEMPKE